MKSICVSLFLLCFLIRASSQDIAGTVKNKNQQGIPYVNVGIPANAFGVISDEKGNFKLKITTEKESDTVRISSIGYTALFMRLDDFKKQCAEQVPFILAEDVKELAIVQVRPNDYETKVLGTTHVADLQCINLSSLRQKDSASVKRYREKGIGEKAAGIEIGNLISIKKGRQTFIDRIQFKTCLGETDTAIYRVNIYFEGETAKRVISPIGIIKLIRSNNQLKEPIIVKTIGKTEVHDIDMSSQNIQVDDDFIIGLECIYASNAQMNIGAVPALFGSTDLLIRESIMDEWIKVPVVDLTFISATVMYKKRKR